MSARVHLPEPLDKLLRSELETAIREAALHRDDELIARRYIVEKWAQMDGINTNILQTGFGIQNAVQQGTVAGMQNTNAIQAQLAQCCCDNEKGQMQITNSMDSGFCQTNYNLATNTNAIIQNAHSDTDRVIAKLDAMEMSRKDETIAALRSQVDALNLAQSQANQNNYLVNTLRPCPTPAYLTCNPWGGVAYGSCASGCCA